MPKVSICIPAFNQPEYLKKAIDSVLIQTYNNYEIIITDDSATNIVKEVVDHYALPNTIKYFKNKHPLGSPKNWNEAISKSTGEYIKILHHDDWLNYDNSLAKYVQLLDENPDCDFGFSSTLNVSPNGQGSIHSITESQVDELQRNPLLLFRGNIVGAPSTTIMRRNTELYYDENLKWLVDTECYIRQIIKNNNIKYSSDLLVVTFSPKGRVTDECINNKQLLIFESLYHLNKINKIKNKFLNKSFKKCILITIKVCEKYNIKNVEDVKACGYNDKIHLFILLYFHTLKISNFFGKVYLKILFKFI